LKFSESSSNGSYRNTGEVWWRYGISRSCQPRYWGREADSPEVCRLRVCDIGLGVRYRVNDIGLGQSLIMHIQNTCILKGYCLPAAFLVEKTTFRSVFINNSVFNLHFMKVNT
jgi:hypothetical protein